MIKDLIQPLIVDVELLVTVQTPTPEAFEERIRENFNVEVTGDGDCRTVIFDGNKITKEAATIAVNTILHDVKEAQC